MKTYVITPANGEAEYELQADRYEFDKVNGRHLFYTGTAPNEELVGNLINASVRRKPDA